MHIIVLIIALALGIGALIWYHSQGINLLGGSQVRKVTR